MASGMASSDAGPFMRTERVGENVPDTRQSETCLNSAPSGGPKSQGIRPSTTNSKPRASAAGRINGAIPTVPGSLPFEPELLEGSHVECMSQG